MRNLYFGILLLLLIIISLAVGLFLNQLRIEFTPEGRIENFSGLNDLNIFIEGYENTTNKYTEKAKADAVKKGYTSGYAGSGGIKVDISKNPLYNYRTDNYNVEYHDSADVWKNRTDNLDLSFGNVWVIDASGNKVNIPYSSLSNFTTYNKPGTFKYGASSYVPSYEDTIYLSRSTGLPTVSVYDNKSIIPNKYDKQDIYLISRLLQQDRNSALGTEEQNKILKTTNSILYNISTTIDKYTNANININTNTNTNKDISSNVVNRK